MGLNAPLTPQNEIDRLAEVIAPSTIFFGRKYCYRQIGDSISGRRWGSRLWSKGCVCPLVLRLQCLLMLCIFALPFLPCTLSLSFCIFPVLYLSPSSSLSFTFYILLLNNTLPTQHLSPTSLHFPLFPSSRVFLTIFICWPFLWAWRGKLYYPVASR